MSNFISRFILQLSRSALVAFLTLLAIILANLLSYGINSYFSLEYTSIEILRATVIPLFLAPLLSWHLITRSFRLVEVKAELKEIVTYDSLTKLLSRRAFLEQADTLHRQSITNGSPLSILAIDLDRFKGINDRYGHSAGDYILYKFGVLVKSLDLGSNICGRLGGEEFAIVLTETDNEKAIEFAETLRQTIINSILIYKTKEISVTTSIGISTLDLDDRQSLDDLLIEADRALYKAKRTGRNKTVAYDFTDNASVALQSNS